MGPQTTHLRIVMTPDGFYPRALQWQGSTKRVLSVERCWTNGPQRRFRVRTPDGFYELGQNLGSGSWQLLRRPGWIERARTYLAALPRYALPASRRRTSPSFRRLQAQSTPVAEGGGHASRLALVRQ